MENWDYIKQKIEIYNCLLCFIDEENQINQNFDDFIEIIRKYKYEEKIEEFKTILYLVSEIGKNHHRSESFTKKIEKIISHYSEFLKQNYTQYELFKIFKKNPQILHFLFVTNIITVDESLIKLLLKEPNQIFTIRKYKSEKRIDYDLERRNHFNKMSIFQNYLWYFYMDIQSNFNDEEKEMIKEELFDMNENIFNDFDQKCKEGENDSYICKLIRNDLVKEFIIYVNKTNMRLNIEIIPTIFETNIFLFHKKSSLIEYAAFYGSIQIFNYLRMNKIELTPSLWLYAIHGNNPEIIHILEENHVEPSDKTYTECLKMSIKCHHNDIARYIENNLMKERVEVNEQNFENNSFLYGFHYYNYEFIHDLIESNNFKFQFFYACLYDHFPIVEHLIQTKKVDINQTIIQKSIFYKTIFFIFNERI